jgi:regulator of protease activity HflC (stomatin/prohibitin superfamily)
LSEAGWGLSDALRLLADGADWWWVLLPALARASHRVVESGQVGVKFSFGKVVGVMEPGWHFLLPLVQALQMVQVRERTLELEDQQVTTLEGLVWQVHAAVVYQVEDPARAVVEVADLEAGLRDVLVLGVADVLRDRSVEAVRAEREEMDQRLALSLQQAAAAWGVKIHHASLVSVAPVGRSLRLSQLEASVQAARAAWAQTEPALGGRLGLGLLGPRGAAYRTRGQRLRAEDARWLDRLRAWRRWRIGERRA